MRRYVIIGAGAIGGGIGARLVQADIPTVLVARGDHLAALQDTGLRLRTPAEDVTLPVTAVGSIADVTLGPDDVIVVSIKTQQLLDVLPDIADAPVRDGAGRELGTVGELLPVFLATNGVSAEPLAARYVRRVFGICLWMPAVHLEPGEVIIRGVPVSGVLHLGRVPAERAEPADRELLEEVAGDWRRATFGVELPEQVMAWKHRKLISNLGNVLDALVDDQTAAGPVREAADIEARTVLAAAGIAVVDDATEAAARAEGFTVEPVPGLEGTRLGGSSWQSLTRGTGSIETDYLNGEIVRVAYEHGLEAPVNARLARLARTAIRRGDGAGSVAATDLLADLDRSR